MSRETYGGKKDRFNGITVDLVEEGCDNFQDKLKGVYNDVKYFGYVFILLSQLFFWQDR